MYALLVIPVVLIALWLVGGIVYGWVKRSYGALVMLGSAGLVAIAALSVILFVGPYWIVIYDTVIQPG
jgi:hypothetical protein